jgi:MFS family permease
MSIAQPSIALSSTGRWVVLLAAFAGWLCAGMEMQTLTLVTPSLTQDLLGDMSQVGAWVAKYNAAFLLGAAVGGLPFGWLGDRAGRVRAMGLSILCYSLMSGACYFANRPEEFMLLRFLTGLGVGGIWPNGVALVSEAWSEVSRPTLAGLIGAAANVGIVILSVVAYYQQITPESWRWVMLVGATPAPIGVFVLLAVPESPRWLATRGAKTAGPSTSGSALFEVFRPPLLRNTLIGICLGTIPLLGGWGSTNWLVLWTEHVVASKPLAAGQTARDGDSTKFSANTGDSPTAVPKKPDYRRKALTQMTRSGGAVFGSLVGGWLASLYGRRLTYFLLSLGSLLLSQWIFGTQNPAHPAFQYWTFALGLVGTVYFGWLPLYLPELFPTRVRSTGAGVSFNFGRILTAAGVLGTGALTVIYHDDFSKVGAITSLVFALGMVVICFAPDTTAKRLQD